MALQTSGPISLGNVRTELKASGPISLGSAAVRDLAGKPTGPISLSNLHGKSSFPGEILWQGRIKTARNRYFGHRVRQRISGSVGNEGSIQPWMTFDGVHLVNGSPRSGAVTYDWIDISGSGNSTIIQLGCKGNLTKSQYYLNFNKFARGMVVDGTFLTFSKATNGSRTISSFPRSLSWAGGLYWHYNGKNVADGQWHDVIIYTPD